MFDGFRLEVVDVGPVELRVRIGGEGPPVVLLHGHPRTHTTWHRVAPVLAATGRTVICPDLRGYGGSTKPATDIDHSPYSKRAMASDIVKLMRRLGHEHFDLAGHDRGSYVAFRLALNHPASVRRLALLDCVPIGDVLARTDARFATAWWHWFFYAQLGIPERVINADPAAWHGGDLDRMGSGNYEDFSRAIADAATVRAMLEVTAQGWESTALRTRPIARRVDGSNAQSWFCGHPVMTFHDCTATLARSGVRGPAT